MSSLIWILLMVGARATAKFTHHVPRCGSRGSMWRPYTTMPNLQVLRHQTHKMITHNVYVSSYHVLECNPLFLSQLLYHKLLNISSKVWLIRLTNPQLINNDISHQKKIQNNSLGSDQSIPIKNSQLGRYDAVQVLYLSSSVTRERTCLNSFFKSLK